jgi:hypothetical protein
LSIFGPGPSASPTALITQSGQQAVTVSTGGSNTATVILDGLDLAGSNGATAGLKKVGVVCNQGGGSTSLTVRNSLVHDSGKDGIGSNGCDFLTVTRNIIGANSSGGAGNGGAGILSNGDTTVVVDGNLVSANTGGGISLTTVAGSNPYIVTNNIIQSNTTSPGASLIGPVAGTFAFNTVANNGVGSGTSGIACSGANKPVIDSIIWDNNHTQMDATCTPTTNDAIGTGPSSTSPSFTADYHLMASVGTSACCVDKIATPGTPNADHDVDFTVRPKGTSATPYDVGAHELQ